MRALTLHTTQKLQWFSSPFPYPFPPDHVNWTVLLFTALSDSHSLLIYIAEPPSLPHDIFQAAEHTQCTDWTKVLLHCYFRAIFLNSFTIKRALRCHLMHTGSRRPSCVTKRKQYATGPHCGPNISKAHWDRWTDTRKPHSFCSRLI